MKRGTGKYKGKLHLKCFPCGKIGHFASKFPYEKNSYSDEHNSFKSSKKYNNYQDKKRSKFAKKKSLLTKRNNNSSSEDSNNGCDSDSNNESEPEKVLFMAINSNEVLNSDEESETEGEVYLKE